MPIPAPTPALLNLVLSRLPGRIQTGPPGLRPRIPERTKLPILVTLWSFSGTHDHTALPPQKCKTTSKQTGRRKGEADAAEQRRTTAVLDGVGQGVPTGGYHSGT